MRVLVVLVGIILFSSPLRVLAQTAKVPTGNGFRITPVRELFVIQKGASKTFKITVTNPSDSPLTARPIVNDFIPSADESGEPRLILDPDTVLPRNDFKRLVSPLEEMVIPPRQEKTIDVTISVPTDAEAGGYYGAVRFVPVLPTEDGKNVALTASIGTIVLVTVPGELRQQLDLVQLSASQSGTARGFLIGGNVGVVTRLKNTGNIHVQPFGKVLVKNMFGKTIHEFEFNAADQSGQRASVLPDSIRKFVDELPKKRWLGRYSIQLNLTYTEGGGEIISSKTNFWYFPVAVFYGLLALLLIVILGINLVVYRVKKKRKTHHHHQ